MRPEILLKAYVLHQCDDAFSELVAGTLDEVHSTALRIVQGPPHLVEEVVLRVYWQLSRKSARLGEDVALSSWLHEQTCKIAVIVLREENRSVDRAALKLQKQGVSSPGRPHPAPPGLATRVSQGILLNSARHKGFHLSLPSWGPRWVQRARIGAGMAGLCVVIIVLWNNPFHKRNPIVLSPELQLTPASFAQLATPEEGAVSPEPIHIANTNAQTNAQRQ
jgi:hypothetical protein